MTDKEALLKLLFHAFVQIREEAHDAKLSKTFHLADLFHNAPLELLRAEDNADYDEIMTKIRRRASQKNIEAWIDNTLEWIEEHHTS